MRYSALLLLILLTIGCGSDKQTRSLDDIVIAIDAEPQRINPVFATSSIENSVIEYVFLSLCDFDPVTNDIVPVLTTEVPQGQVTTDAAGNKTTTYTINILPDATWGDGTPITGHDYEFLLKLINVPDVEAAAWQRALSNVSAVNVDKDNPKQFDIVTTGDYFLAYEVILTAEIFPKHVYDASGLLSEWSYEDFIKEGFFENLDENEKAKLAQFAKEFSDFKYSQTSAIDGAGPYELTSWETGQYLVLNKKKDYWGANYPDRTFLQANADKLVFQFISDPTVMMTQIKGGDIDVANLTKAAAAQLNDLKANEDFKANFEMHYPEVPAIYYIMLNNKDKRLNDPNVRRALAHLMDVPKIIEQQEGGYGTVTNSIIPKSKSYYDKSIAPIAYDIDQAKSLLADAGWSDSNNDGTLDKMIDGKREELSLRFFISGSALSKILSSLLASSAQEAGVNIEIITKTGRAVYAENIAPGDYELFAGRATSEGDFDGHLLWHSSSTGSNGRNWVNYNSEKADEYIMAVRNATSDSERHQAYINFQQQMVKDQPVIILYAPVEKIAVSKKYKPLISSKRPGYFANCFRAAE